MESTSLTKEYKKKIKNNQIQWLPPLLNHNCPIIAEELLNVTKVKRIENKAIATTKYNKMLFHILERDS